MSALQRTNSSQSQFPGDFVNDQDFIRVLRISGIIITIAGIAFLIGVRRRSPSATRLGVLGLVTLLAFQILYLLFFDIWHALEQIFRVDGVLSLRGMWSLLHFLQVAGVGLLVWAIVSDRRPAAGQVGAESADVED